MLLDRRYQLYTTYNYSEYFQYNASKAIKKAKMKIQKTFR